uniref:Phage protein n=1 Tax=Heterorhabditis bacteriophora TaxID=37862 RepID=A0A1I7X6Q5_HETBA
MNTVDKWTSGRLPIFLNRKEVLMKIPTVKFKAVEYRFDDGNDS